MSNRGKLLNEYVSDYVVFDLETTGINSNYDEVIEISAIKVVGGKVVDEFSTLVNPQRHIPEMASDVNGIYDDMVADAPVFEDALGDFIKFAGDAVLVGHNIASFDMKFIWRDAEKFWGLIIENNYIDTLKLARTYLPKRNGYKLADLADYYGISADGAHRALNDCRMNQQVFEYLGKEIANASEEMKKVRKCPKCGNIMIKRSGCYGEFWGCASFPDCRFTMNS